MRLAILGDIHGNIHALTAAYGAAMAESPDEVLHLGDLGGYAPFVNEVVAFIRDKGIRGVRGNYDRNVAEGNEHCGCKYEDPLMAELSQRSFDWTKQKSSDESKAFMLELPPTITIKNGGRAVMLFHAAPHKDTLYWFEDRPDKFFAEMGEKAGTDVLIYGHTHKPYVRELEGRTFINAGSVGKPKDGDARTCVAIVDIDEARVNCRFVRLDYDIASVARAITDSGLPGEFAEKLRQAR